MSEMLTPDMFLIAFLTVLKFGQVALLAGERVVSRGCCAPHPGGRGWYGPDDRERFTLGAGRAWVCGGIAQWHRVGTWGCVFSWAHGLHAI